MALDTQDKRASALFPGLRSHRVLPLPNGEIDSGDRLQLALLYRGIAASQVEVEVTTDAKQYSRAGALETQYSRAGAVASQYQRAGG